MGMQIENIADVLKASVITPDLDLRREVVHAFSSDLMSDVLTGDHYKTVLVTGLSNLQAIRTAEMSDIDLATERNIVLLKSSYLKILPIIRGHLKCS